MINLTWAEKGKGKATWEVKAERRPNERPTEGAIKLLEKPKATIIKGVVLCSKCQRECELEVPAARAIIDQELIKRGGEEGRRRLMEIMRAAERETSRNVFQRLGGDSQSKNLSEVFRNHEASEEVEDKEAKTPQQGYAGGDVRIANPGLKKSLTRLRRKWYIVGKDGRPIKEMGASMIRRVQRQHKAYMNSLKVPTASETSKNVKLESARHEEKAKPQWRSKNEGV